ncbi:MAG: rhodanese-like domain-containing protein [Bdellovibrionota bacterium]
MIRLIDLEHILLKQEQGEKIYLIEASPKPEYDQLHPKNAIHLPEFDFEIEVRKALPSLGLEIVVYGDRPSSPDAWELAQRLDELGYSNVYLYRGGKLEWVREGLPTEGMHLAS